MPDTPSNQQHQPKNLHQDPLTSERALAADQALVDELSQLLFARRSNAIEISNLAFILRHRPVSPLAARALERVEQFGKLVLARGMDPSLLPAARQDLGHAARELGLEYVFLQHAAKEQIDTP